MPAKTHIDTEATALQRQGELGLWAPLLGQEAAQVGGHVPDTETVGHVHESLGVGRGTGAEGDTVDVVEQSVRVTRKLVQIGKPRPGVTPVERAPRCPEKIPGLE